MGPYSEAVKADVRRWMGPLPPSCPPPEPDHPDTPDRGVTPSPDCLPYMGGGD